MVGTLEARDVAFAYQDGPTVLGGLDLVARPGEMVALLGPNGAGKSTMLRLCAGLLAPGRGSVTVDGREVANLGAGERARTLAFVPQGLRALPEVTVEAFVGYGRYAHGGLFRRARPHDREVVMDALAQTDASDLAARPLLELSGGQRQRVLVARALAQEAPLLLVDEPTGALDPEHQVRTFDLLARLTSEGRTVVVVTHELNLASQFATGVALLDGGVIVATGGPSEVLVRERLEPVYGEDLVYGERPAPRGEGTRPFVVPWLGGEGGEG